MATEQEIINYRFSGYQLPMIQLDETGPSYYCIKGIHPYYTSQPAYWQQPYFKLHQAVIGRESSVSSGTSATPTTQGSSEGDNSSGVTNSSGTSGKLHCMLGF